MGKFAVSRVRALQIEHFRGIQSLEWMPSEGVNCLIGPGDVGKSTVLDAIDFCLGGRRTLQLSDADFFRLDVQDQIQIRVTVGELDDEQKRLDTHGLYLRGFDLEARELLPEPEAGKETVLTIQLVVHSDLDPAWTLYSERAAEQDLARHLSWADRLKLAPTRIGAFADYNLGWRRGSILNRVSEERADISAEVAAFARQARKVFGETAKEQVKETLQLVKQAARELGIPVEDVTAMLDAQSVSVSGGTISLHDGEGVPLRGLGLGSVRLLVAGLQRAAATKSSIVLVDEIEHGLEPHRIIRLLNSLGAKDDTSPLQVFMTTHSPVALRELAADQLYVLRRGDGAHEARHVGRADYMQATVRACPEAFLAPAVIVCEGRSEVGLVRGLDLHRVENGIPSITAQGASVADGQGETTFRRANSLLELGYRVLIVRDSDKEAPADESTSFDAGGGSVVSWEDGNALEEALFMSVSDDAVHAMLSLAAQKLGEDLVNDQIKSATGNSLDLSKCRDAATPEIREALGTVAKGKKAAWFKSVSDMEIVGRDIVGPDLEAAASEFRAKVDSIFEWVSVGQ
jgi:predicted ATP-dependent endonuclease of OLD family